MARRKKAAAAAPVATETDAPVASFEGIDRTTAEWLDAKPGVDAPAAVLKEPDPLPGVGGLLHFYRYKAKDGCKASAVGELRPCVVVRRWLGEYGDADGYNVQVFTDGANDFEDGRATLWVTSVRVGCEPGEICGRP